MDTLTKFGPPPASVVQAPTSQYMVSTWTDNANGYFGRGGANLVDTNHPFQTNLSLNVFHMGPTAVPGPVMGGGVIMWIAAACILIAWCGQRLSAK